MGCSTRVTKGMNTQQLLGLMMITLSFVTMVAFFGVTSFGSLRVLHPDYKVSVIRTQVSNMCDDRQTVTTPDDQSNVKETNSSRLKNETNSSRQKNETSKPKGCYRQIQRWMGSEKAKPWGGGITKCPGLDCGLRYVIDSSFETMMESHVVIHDRHHSKWNWAEMQRRRPPHQAWMYSSMESTELPDVAHQHLYNYTMTYRSSSTFPSPYGFYDTSRRQISRSVHLDVAKGRTKMVVWVASNCYKTMWRRFDFVKELSKHVEVDIFGKCGQPEGCDRESKSCWNRIQKYKFYLSLENNQCRDYITEKFWRTALQHQVVPIVYGAPKEDYERVAPPHSFIHLQDFSSMSELVDYLNLLNTNDTLYNAYFQWKKQGIVRGRGIYVSHKTVMPFYCQVVKKVLEDEKRGISGSRIQEGANSTVFDSWHKQCSKPSGFPHDF